MPAVALGNNNEFFPCGGTIHTYPSRVRTKMPPPRKAISAVSTGDVSLADDEVAARKALHVIPDSINNTGKLVPDRHRHWNGILRPLIPVVDVHVSPADRRLQHTD